MATYQTTFTEQLGSTNEVIDVTIEYCGDLNGDGFDDIRISLAIDPASNSGTEDMIGVAFDIQNDALAGLQVTDIQRATSNGTLSSFTPAVVMGANQVSDGGPLDPGFNTSGGGSDEPYDIGIKFSDEGSGEGIVQSASFILTSAGQNLDAEALLENTDWWVRLQSTDGGAGSAKMGGALTDLPACEDEPPPPPPCDDGDFSWNLDVNYDFDASTGLQARSGTDLESNTEVVANIAVDVDISGNTAGFNVDIQAIGDDGSTELNLAVVVTEDYSSITATGNAAVA